MAAAALGAVGLTITIPLVTKAIIDGPIADRDLDALLPLGILALVLGVLEAFLIWVRRWVQSNAVLGLETEIRHDLYERLQALPMSFHTKWESGQLLSRATQDLSSIRRFAGFGLLFLVLNILQVTVVTGVLLKLYWPLGLVVAATALPVIWLSMRFEKTYVVVSRRVQDEQGDLATLAEEGAVGIRVIKSFGRSEHVSGQYEGAARTALRHVDGQGPALGEVLDLPRGDPEPGRRHRAADRCDRGRQGAAHHGGARGVHQPVALAGLAGRLARRDPGHGPGGDDLQRPDPRDLRHRARHRVR